MPKSKWFLSALLLIALTSCIEQASSSVLSSIVEESSEEVPLIRLYEEDSSFVGAGYGPIGSAALPTYRHKDFGEVPFIELKDFLPLIRTDVIEPPVLSKVADHLYAVSCENIIGALLDTKTETLTFKRYDYFARALCAFNNGVSYDLANPIPLEDSSVHASDKTKVHGEYKDEVYDLKKYHFDLVEQDDKVYVPFQLFANLIFRTNGADILYNGHDYFLSTLSGPNQATCYSSNDTFRYSDLFFQPIKNVPAGESKRYVASNPASKSDVDKFAIFALKSDGTGAYFHAATQDGALEGNPEAELVWEIKEDQDTYIGVKILDPVKKEYVETPSYMRIRHGTEYYNSKRRDESVAKFSYDLLRFQFDELYGLKEELAAKQGYTDFDTFVTAKGLKNDLLSLDSLVYDEALADFTMRYVDDGHTKYIARSIYSGETEKSASATAVEHQGPRRGGLLEKLSEYTTLRKEKTGLENPLGVYMEGETAVIRFDAFSHAAGYIPALPEDAKDYGLQFVLSLSTPWGFDMAFEEIKKNSDVKNVVLDLTCNGGGMVMTLPYLAAFFTADPTLWSHDALMGVDREFHYNVDLNHNGIFGEPEDTYAGKYDFYLLTSDFSFSCGTAFPAMAKTAGVKTIGMRSGGGACSVGYYSDGSGSLYSTSSPLQIGTVDEKGKFVNDDAGIPVDYELDKESWYDLGKLDAFVKGLKN
ncbi:MAG: hypothetical protein IJS37_04815 [Bacilli bacterium]|nr:hypothetical protein [Bacilli bacterium]